MLETASPAEAREALCGQGKIRQHLALILFCPDGDGRGEEPLRVAIAVQHLTWCDDVVWIAVSSSFQRAGDHRLHDTVTKAKVIAGEAVTIERVSDLLVDQFQTEGSCQLPVETAVKGMLVSRS